MRDLSALFAISLALLLLVGEAAIAETEKPMSNRA
jgi:hypothetical protein